MAITKARQGSTSRGHFSVYIRVLFMGYVLIIIILLSARVCRQCSGGLNRLFVPQVICVNTTGVYVHPYIS
ncbi:hypothetical protein BMJ20_04605 [Sinorhizobium medicae]|nr:hypothetical protein BMJ20_04605 [Sinorhizobium medicae]